MSRSSQRAAAIAIVLVVLVGIVAALVGSGGGRTGERGSDASPTVRTSVAPSASAARPSRAATASSTARDPDSGLRLVRLVDLPRQAQQTIALIDAGGPFPYEKDGVTFGNYEGVLPKRARGYYREYTVVTPGENDRGPRRIVTGGSDRDRELFYTADHYATFVRVLR